MNYDAYACPPFMFPPCPNLVEALEKAMRGEAEAVEYYGMLGPMAPDRFQAETIAKIREDEKRHLNNFQALYCTVTGGQYKLPDMEVRCPRSYREGLMKSFQDEQEAYEFYKNNLMCQADLCVKFCFQDAMLDEAEHARWFNNFLIRMIRERK